MRIIHYSGDFKQMKYLTLSLKNNKARIQCPIFLNAGKRRKLCFLREKVWRDERIEVRRG